MAITDDPERNESRPKMHIIDKHPQRRRSDEPQNGQDILTNLEGYWQTLRHAQRVPSRNDIEPRLIDDAIPHAFILQRVAPGIGRIRVAGQRLHDLIKMDARGMPISSFFAPEARDRLAKLVEAAFRDPAIISIPLYIPGSFGRAAVTGTMLLLPLRDHTGATSRILGAVVTEGDIGRKARRFTIADNVPIRHDSIGPRLASVTPLFQRSELKKPDAGRPALRLVVDNA
ncbi:PAS domain-containing protein [Yoonia sp. 2307UL14-13]|uniref:PAS domain-containing protein n=1 Tax=Yoonia sp. 2307UL14-13 TaxID=3126506 RepID=UPI0030A7EA54